MKSVQLFFSEAKSLSKSSQSSRLTVRRKFSTIQQKSKGSITIFPSEYSSSSFGTQSLAMSVSKSPIAPFQRLSSSLLHKWGSRQHSIDKRPLFSRKTEEKKTDDKESTQQNEQNEQAKEQQTQEKQTKEGQQSQQPQQQQKEQKDQAKEQQHKTQVEEFQKKIKSLEEQIEELKTNLKYSYAERENMRRIGEENARKNRDYGIQSFAKALLNVNDNFSRALSNLKQEHVTTPEFKMFFEGIQMTQKELLKVFKDNGVEEFSPKVGDKFDPNNMNAMLEVPDPTKESQSVAFVIKSGFMLKDRVLRAADVGVTKGGPVRQEQPKQDQQKQEGAKGGENTQK